MVLDGFRPVAVGIGTTWEVWGSFRDGRSRRLEGDLIYSSDPAGQPLEIVMGDRGDAWVTATQPGEAFLVVTGHTERGRELRATQRLIATEAQELSLGVGTLQDGPWTITPSTSFEDARARAPVGSMVRVLSSLRFVLPVRTDDGRDIEIDGRVLLPPNAVTYEMTEGTVDALGRFQSETAGEFDIHVRYSNGASIEATAHAVFVPAGPPTGLLFTYGQALLSDVNPGTHARHQYPEGTLSLSDFVVGGLDNPAARVDFFAPGDAMTVQPVVVHGTGDREYYVWPDWSDVVFRTLTGMEVFELDEAGQMTGREPGISAWVAQVAGLEMPGLTTTRFPEPLPILRADPSPLLLAMPAPRSPANCAEVRMYVTLPGEAERELTPLERSAVRSSHDSGPDNHGSHSLEFCADPTAGWTGTSLYDLRFINAWVPFTLVVD